MKSICLILLIVTALVWVPFAAAQGSSAPADAALAREQALELGTASAKEALQSVAARSDTGYLSSGGLHTCGLLASGTAVCWGYDGAGRASPPAGERFVSISSGSYHTCGLRSDGMAVCWGSNASGQARPPAGEQFTSISSGTNHTCGLRADGTAECWGATRIFAGEDLNWGQASPPDGERFAVSWADPAAATRTDDHAD